MPRSVRQEWEEAVEVVPALVQRETPCETFLRVEQYDPTRAATRLAMYWKGRKILFGERWLLPMNQVCVCNCVCERDCVRVCVQDTDGIRDMSI